MSGRKSRETQKRPSTAGIVRRLRRADAATEAEAGEQIAAEPDAVWDRTVVATAAPRI
ncbi:hypothetical protein [Mycobacterium europaeum]|uniref:hypothetical protein n=1 Tax=Mycobacterium europaeum TaxID=761804 RepID=UPI001301A263|nr:hypothetical protein [Mycobacterium europaeum]